MKNKRHQRSISARGTRLPVLKTIKLYIGGQFPRTESGRYYVPKSRLENPLGNISRASKKDFREAVVKARGALKGWSGRSAFNRGQVLYRIAEMLEGRKAQFVDELQLQGAEKHEAEREILCSIDRVLYYAGWCDKYQQIFSSVNPVASSHFNFSMLEPTGVVSVIAPEQHSMLGIVTSVIPVIAGGNTCIALASESKPLCPITFGEVLNSSDVPAGAVNILTGFRNELCGQFSSHMDVNAVTYWGNDKETIKTIQHNATLNVKRPVIHDEIDLFGQETETPYFILETQEVKTTWHPVGV